MWETFHIDQIVPWVDANLRTIRSRAGRAIAGLSQGGFGALSYAARHPDLFTSVARSRRLRHRPRSRRRSRRPPASSSSRPPSSAAAAPDAMFGPRATQELNWQAHDPATLVTNLRGTQIRSGRATASPATGSKVPFDPEPSLSRRSRSGRRGLPRLPRGRGNPQHLRLLRSGTHSFHTGPRSRRVRRPDDAALRHPPPQPRGSTICRPTIAGSSGVGRSARAAAPRSTVCASAAPGLRAHRDGPREVRTPPFYPPGAG